MNEPGRQIIAAVIGPARPEQAEIDVAAALGEALVSVGFLVATGGLGGVMEAASRGAHRSQRYRRGSTIGILPTYDSKSANPWVDIAIPTGLGHARNVLVVSTAQVVLAVGGRSGTLSEIALAWTLGKPIIAVGHFPGWATTLAGRAIDDRRDSVLHGPYSPEEAAEVARTLIQRCGDEAPREF